MCFYILNKGLYPDDKTFLLRIDLMAGILLYTISLATLDKPKNYHNKAITNTFFLRLKQEYIFFNQMLPLAAHM